MESTHRDKSFFRALCGSRISKKEMFKLRKMVVESICKLEAFFLPSFFDCMEHLTIHIPYEALVGGPVYYRWMYPFERRMFVLKKMVKNKARVEGFICESYLELEVSNFLSHYFEDDVDNTILQRNKVAYKSQFHGQFDIFVSMGKTGGQGTRFAFDLDDYNATMYYVLDNCNEMNPYISHFEQLHALDRYGHPRDDNQWRS